LLAKLKRKKRPSSELAWFIQKNLFAHAIALKKIIFRLEPPRDDGEQKNLLDRLYDQMLIYREKTSIAQKGRPCRPHPQPS
jgi:hypothetical protein